MKKTLLLLAAVLVVVGLRGQDCGPFNFRNFSVADSSGLEVIGRDTFRLASNYPTALPEKPTKGFGWDKIDFVKKPESFMSSVLGYCLEGNVESDFASGANDVRNWYHAPWMDYGYLGREPMHGLVMDRTSYGDDFASGDNDRARNYSLTMYNDRAAYTLGQVWCNSNQPDPSKASFAEGSVFFKLTFTTGDTILFPFLKNGYNWEAYVEKSTMLPIDDKKVAGVKLFELEFAVKTKSSKAPTGWVMGSFIFDGGRGAELQDQLLPVSLQWGNDPGITPQMVRTDSATIEESWINPEAFDPEDKAGSIVKKLGWAGRAKSPIGNISSSMLSEAMTAGWPAAPMVAPENIPMDSVLNWFKNVPSGEAFMANQTSLDFSLELVRGMQNHAVANGDSAMGMAMNSVYEEVLGFIPPDKSKIVEEEEEVIEYDEGLEGRNLFVFIGFIIMVLVLGGLLALNILKK